MSTHLKSAVAEVDSLDHGRRNIATSPTRCVPNDSHNKFGVRLKADQANTEPIYVGNSDVTAATETTTDGFPLWPGEEIWLPLGQARDVWAIAPTTSQTVFYILV